MNIKKAYQKYIVLLTASLLVCLFVVPKFAVAKDSFASSYMQTVYNQSNGIGSNEINCLYQSKSGYIYVGTDTGLYRSNGNEFLSVNLWDTDKTDVYSISCITQDETGRVWIGTRNFGLFYIENGETHHLLDDYYDGIKTINAVCEGDAGRIYVATTSGLFYIDKNASDDVRLSAYEDAEAEKLEFTDMTYFDGNIWALYGTTDIYILDQDGVSYVIDTTKAEADGIKCLESIDDRVYAGSTGNEIVSYRSRANYDIYTTSVYDINSIMKDADGKLWVCADNGVGFFNESREFSKVNELEIDSYVSDAIQDYEGNYWIASEKLGLLYMAKSKFVDFNELTGMQETIVNCVFVNGKEKYIGTDDGLFIYDKDNNKVESDLSTQLSGVSIRDIMKDSAGNIWIAAYRRQGIVRMSTDGSIKVIGRNEGLTSLAVTSMVELEGGYIAAATDTGIVLLDKSGNIKKEFGANEGIKENAINCLYENESGNLMFGTDGDGIGEIDIESGTINYYTSDDGLNSNNISAFAEGDDGVWIGTDNGLCFYNDTFRTVSNVDFSNSIYDIVIKDNTVWMIGSKGVISATEEELLGAENLSSRYLDKNDGLTKTLNTTSDTIIDSNNILYICCNTGLYTLDTNDIAYNTTAPKIRVTAVDVDGKTYEFDDITDGLLVDSSANKITVKFAVFSYSNRENIKVEYELKGFDNEPTEIPGTDSMEAVYTNLDGGNYEFTVSAVNGDGVECEEPISFIIDKKSSLFEMPIAKIAIIVVAVLAVFGIIYGALKTKKMLQNKNTALEKLSKEHEEAVKTSNVKNDYLANMSNEIKTPVNMMVVKAEEMLNTIPEDAPYKADIASICQTGNEIIERVDDIILLAKIEAGKVEFKNQPYSVTDLVYELSQMAQPKLEGTPIKLYVNIGDELSDNVIGDYIKIKDILARILDNAVKYTREGSITISVDSYEYIDKNQQGMVNLVFTVSDTGVGIAEDRIESIFEIYSIDDNRKSGYNAGNGIGLAIAKGYADALDAEITAESVYGAGSTFTLSINQKLVEKISKNMIVSKIDETLTKEAADKLWLPEVNLLLVDDDEQSLEITKKALAKFEMKIDVASSGISAIDMVMNNEYDVVFMDLSMPVMNGTDAMLEIREISDIKYSMLPIIAMDNDAIESNKDELLEIGFTDSIVKPIDVRRVAAIFKDCLPESKLQEKTNDMSEYIKLSRYGSGLTELGNVLDIETAIERIGGSIDVYNKLIIAFYNQNYTSVEDLKEKLAKDVRTFRNKLHTLKTGSSNIGATELAQEATRLEAAINIGNKEYTKDNLVAFTAHLDETLMHIADYVDFLDTISGITDEEYAELLAQKHSGDTSAETEQTAKDEAASGEQIAENEVTSSEQSAEDTSENIQKKSDSYMEQIDVDMLESIKYAAADGDYDMAEEYIEMLKKYEYNTDDREFLAVLSENIANKNTAEVEQLVTTYMDLKI